MELSILKMIVLEYGSMDLYHVDTSTLIEIHEIITEQMDNETEWYESEWDDELEAQFDAICDELMVRGVL
jgi:hypothetical protein